MNVGVLIDRWEPDRGGAERALSLLVGRLVDDGVAVHVYGLSAAPGAPGMFVAVEVPHLPRGRLERELAARSLERARGDGCEVVIAIRHTPACDAYWPHGGSHRATLAGGEASRTGLGRGISRLLHRFSGKQRAFLDLEADLLARGGAKTVWCVSEMVRDELAAAHPACADRLELRANGVDRERFHPGLRDAHRAAVLEELSLDPEAPVFLFQGGNWQLKGWFLLVKALERALHLNWSCVAVGAREKQIAWAVRGAPFADRVRVLPRRDPLPLYGVADLLLQPTFRDPCSLATLEALACGVPVLTSDANGAADAITTTDAGQVVPAGSWVPFAEAFDEWAQRLASPDDRARSSEAARAATEGRDLDAWYLGLRGSLNALAT